MGLDTDLTNALRGAVRQLTVRDLKRKRVDSVKVIEHSRFLEILERVEHRAREQSIEADKKRLERLIQENEKLGHEKKKLEHARGLVEAERSQLQATLDEIVTEVGRAVGEKLGAEDVRTFVAESQRLRRDNTKAQQALHRLQEQAQARIDEERSRNADLSQDLERIALERELLQHERDRLEEEQRAFRDDIDKFRNERDRFRDERDSYLLSCTKMGQERDALRERLRELDVARQTIGDLEDEVRRLERENGSLGEELDRAHEAQRAVEEELDRTAHELEEAKPTEPEASAAAAPTREAAGGTIPTFGFGFGKPRR